MLNKTNLRKMLKDSENIDYFQEMTKEQIIELENLSLFLTTNIKGYRIRYTGE